MFAGSVTSSSRLSSPASHDEGRKTLPLTPRTSLLTPPPSSVIQPQNTVTSSAPLSYLSNSSSRTSPTYQSNHSPYSTEVNRVRTPPTLRSTSPITRKLPASTILTTTSPPHSRINPPHVTNSAPRVVVTPSSTVSPLNRLPASTTLITTSAPVSIGFSSSSYTSSITQNSSHKSVHASSALPISTNIVLSNTSISVIKSSVANSSLATSLQSCFLSTSSSGRDVPKQSTQNCRSHFPSTADLETGSEAYFPSSSAACSVGANVFSSSSAETSSTSKKLSGTDRSVPFVTSHSVTIDPSAAGKECNISDSVKQSDKAAPKLSGVDRCSFDLQVIGSVVHNSSRGEANTLKTEKKVAVGNNSSSEGTKSSRNSKTCPSGNSSSATVFNRGRNGATVGSGSGNTNNGVLAGVGGRAVSITATSGPAPHTPSRPASPPSVSITAVLRPQPPSSSSHHAPPPTSTCSPTHHLSVNSHMPPHLQQHPRMDDGSSDSGVSISEPRSVSRSSVLSDERSSSAEVKPNTPTPQHPHKVFPPHSSGGNNSFALDPRGASNKEIRLWRDPALLSHSEQSLRHLQSIHQASAAMSFPPHPPPPPHHPPSQHAPPSSHSVASIAAAAAAAGPLHPHALPPYLNPALHLTGLQPPLGAAAAAAFYGAPGSGMWKPLVGGVPPVHPSYSGLLPHTVTSEEMLREYERRGDSIR